MSLSDKEKQMRSELDMVDVAHYILGQKGEVLDFNDLLLEVVEFLGLSEDEMNDHMPQFYTDLNTDGQFISLGDNHWGLRSWYAIDSINEVITDENTEQDILPKKSQDGFDDYDGFVEEYFIDEEDEKADDDEDVESIGDSEEDDLDSEDDLDAYRDDLDELETQDDELENLEIEDEDELIDNDLDL